MPAYHEVIEFWLKVLGVVGALAALTLTWRTHAERATFDMIDRLYSLCHTLEAHAIKDWYLAHLFCIGGEEYNTVKRRIQEQVEPARCPEFLVKEKLYAIHICIIYEQVYYQWKHSSPILHRRRRRFLGEILSYFSDRLLQNPRMVAMLKADPTGASLHLETCSRKFVADATKRLQNCANEDPDGPFLVCDPTDTSAKSRRAG